jgi:hypothetical protein
MFRLFTQKPSKISELLGELRHRLGIPTEQEARSAYLAEAGDRIDLELRIRHLDRTPGFLSSYADRSWRFSS